MSCPAGRPRAYERTMRPSTPAPVERCSAVAPAPSPTAATSFGGADPCLEVDWIYRGALVGLLRWTCHKRDAGKPAEAIASLGKALALGANRPNDLYNAACGYALSGKNDRALDLLENAVAGGFGTRELLSTDHDLDPLRSSPRFQALLERAKQ